MGTLDPKVSGVLPITLGRACKLADYFIRHDKTYVGVLETHKECDIVELQKLIDGNFVGRIKQVPPHRSAVVRVEREREVYSWKLVEGFEDGKSFLFECRVEGGTYVRKLCSDLGEMIGGAHMGELRRTQAGVFGEKGSPSVEKLTFGGKAHFRWESSSQSDGELVRLDEFEAAVEAYENGDDSALRGMVVAAEDAIREVLPVVEVDRSALKALYVGRPLLRANVVGGNDVDAGKSFALFCGDVFVGVYKREVNLLGMIGNRQQVTGLVFGRAEFVKT